MITRLIHKKNLYLYILLSISFGTISSYSLPPHNYVIFNFITFPLFFLILEKFINEKFKSFIIGWSFGFGYFISNLSWITNSLKFIDELKIFIPFAIILTPALLGIFYGFIGLILSLLKIKKNFSSILSFALIFSLVEYCRGLFFTGFPWNLIVYSLTDYIYHIQILSLIGTYTLNLISITFFLLPLALITKYKTKTKFLVIFIFIIIFCTNFLYGKIRLNNFERITAIKLDKKIKIISPNIDLERFLENEDPILRIKEIIILSDPDYNKDGLFIFPEGILSGFSLQDLSYINFVFKENFSKNHNLIIGTNLIDNEKLYNTLTVFNNNLDPIQIYKKNKLVPFGEYLPFENILSKIGLKKITQGYQPFTNSKEREIIKLKGLSILPLICYEIIYSGQIYDSNQFDLIINISEDGWFGDSIGPIQHFGHSIFRSIEEGKNLLRSSNNGISAHINPLGQVLKKIKSTEGGVIKITEIKFIKNTLFSKYGNKIFFYFILIYITLIFFLKKKGQHNEKKFPIY